MQSQRTEGKRIGQCDLVLALVLRVTYQKQSFKVFGQGRQRTDDGPCHHDNTLELRQRIALRWLGVSYQEFGRPGTC